jgi:hypothetical protein
MSLKSRHWGAACAALLASAAWMGTATAEFAGNTGLLPAGSELGDEAFDRPIEVFRSETSGGR